MSTERILMKSGMEGPSEVCQENLILNLYNHYFMNFLNNGSLYKKLDT
jgi:hypothetical protein